MPRFGGEKIDNSGGLSQGERAFRNYLFDKLIDDLGVLQKNGWLGTTSFDTVVQHLSYEKHDPLGARNGYNPAATAAAAGPVPQEKYESDFTEKTLGPLKFKSYKRQDDDGSAVSAVVAGRQATAPSLQRNQTVNQTVQRAIAAPPIPSPPMIAGPPPRQQVIAIADFDTREAGDLRFMAGDVIDVTEDVDSNWYKGRLHGQEGIFPKSYVELR
ncbi:Endophilin-A2 [Rhizophlyctis rosea]|uniref:Endophilin-A2 n=1 Tax=Rhizophlyctis rosea TaxID=64517 RepID=A0AAD5SKQ6_9FUNG|nr:Endophilin-A2 [Rhizophlyctis rosea]